MEKNIRVIDKEERNEEQIDETSEKVDYYEEKKTKEGFDSKTFKWSVRILRTTSGRIWGKIEDMIITLVRESGGNCYFTWQGYITSLGLRTSNNPFGEGNPRFKISFINFVGGVPFFQDIETEIDNSSLYSGLSVKCEYNNELKQNKYIVGNVPYNEIVKASRWIGGASLFNCS